jgi:pimeloyl-ACP methyl ester carboxylesterase
MALKNITTNGITYALSYELVNPSAGAPILFLHGWGANKELMRRVFGGYFKQNCLIFLDLPGFGGSSLQTPLNSYEVAGVVRDFLAAIDKQPSIIIGHSFGGKIATLLSPPNLVLLSSAGIVMKKRLSVRIKIAIFKLMRRIGLGRFYRLFATKDAAGMSRAMYEMLKRVVDEDMSGEFAAYKGRALLFWGGSDDATPPEAGQRINNLIKGSEFYLLSGGHFFFMEHADEIARTIEREILAQKGEGL